MGIAHRCGRLGAVALVAALLAVAPAAAISSASRELSRLATSFRGGIAVDVRCAASSAEWTALLAARRIPPYVVGFAYIGTPRVWLSSPVCAGVIRADPWSVLVFLHELMHTSGVRSERAANCRALASERRFLETRLGLSAEDAQVVYEQSLARALAEPEAYRPVAC